MPRTPKKAAETLASVADEVLDEFGPATGMSMADIDAATRRLNVRRTGQCRIHPSRTCETRANSPIVTRD